MTDKAPKNTGASKEDIAEDRADWLLDAVATATQNRQFLRGETEYDEVAGEAILANGKKAILVAIDKAARLSQPWVDAEKGAEEIEAFVAELCKPWVAFYGHADTFAAIIRKHLSATPKPGRDADGRAAKRAHLREPARVRSWNPELFDKVEAEQEAGLRKMFPEFFEFTFGRAPTAADWEEYGDWGSFRQVFDWLGQRKDPMAKFCAEE